jgi:membrane protein DedA with SNARE-associated domain
MPNLVLIALATLVTEDLTCIATGVLVAQRQVDFWSGTLACGAGIYFGDLLLFLAGRIFGRPAIGFPVVRRVISSEQLDRASAWLDSKGARVVFLSRFAPGLRLPTYFAAGVLKVGSGRFALLFLLAAAIWTPLLVGLTAAVGGPAVRATLATGGRGSLAAAVLYAGWVGIRKAAPALSSLRFRGRVKGFFLRKVRWEFWPAWAAYLPLLPALGWLALKHRSPTLFTAANPGIEPGGGFLGESKSRILANLDRVPGAVAAFGVIPGRLEAARRIERAHEFRARRGLEFPVVLKPDVGERGSGVAIVRSQSELEGYLRKAAGDTIIQEYVSGAEFGVFYRRYPGEPCGRVTSITEKRFPEVRGDGRSTVEELILRDSRAVCLASTYLGRLRQRAEEVPEAGEAVPLAELGSHCRGAVFLDAIGLKTDALETAIDRVAKAHPGFFFGRFDVRAASVEALRQGWFTVIELNGVTAEATHVYDPAVSLAAAYRAMYQHWRMAFEIGEENRSTGARPMPVGELVRLVSTRARGRSGLLELEREAGAELEGAGAA